MHGQEEAKGKGGGDETKVLVVERMHGPSRHSIIVPLFGRVLGSCDDESSPIPFRGWLVCLTSDLETLHSFMQKVE